MNFFTKYKLTVIALFVFLFFCFFVFTDNVSAVGLWDNISCKEKGDCQLNDFIQIGINGSNWILGIVGSLALLFFVYGGMTWILSAGSSERIEAGKTIVKNALIGLVIVFVSWTVINFVSVSLGYDSGKFGEWFEMP